MKTISRYIMTLALLLTAVTGAWATDTYTITFSANGKNKTYTDVVLPAEYKCEYGSPGEFDNIIRELYEQDGGHAIDNATPTVTGTDAITPGVDGPNDYAMITITAPFTGKATVSGTYAGWSDKSGNSNINYSIEVYFGTPSSDDAIDVKWDAATKTGTFTMPDADVELTPIYAPEFTATFVAGNDLTIQGSKATVTVTESGATTGTQVTLDENGKYSPLYGEETITLTAASGYKFRKVEVKKTEVIKTINILDIEIKYSDGDTWEKIAERNPGKVGFSNSGNVYVLYGTERVYLALNSTPVKKSDDFNSNANYTASQVK